MEPQFVDFEDVRRFSLAPGVVGRPLFGDGAMLNLIEFEPGASLRLLVSATSTSSSGW